MVVALLHRAWRSGATASRIRALETRRASTWHGEWWKLGGGGTVWDSMAYDPQLDLLYVGVGNGSPWNHRIRSPRRAATTLFLSSILALEPDDRRVRLALPDHARRDRGTTPPRSTIMLADLDDRRPARASVVMQAPKNGFFYVLDRVTGEFISAKNYVNVT